MNKILVGLFIIGIGSLSIPFVFGDDDDGERLSFFSWERIKLIADKNQINSPYREECGSCHMAYQPGLLPSQSWEVILSNLDKHFGDVASLDEEDLGVISEYVLSHAADKSHFRRSRQFAQTDKSVKIIERITDTLYFRHEHDEVPIRMVKNNDKVQSFSHCNSCHMNAEKGLYDEHDVRIPGYGYWDD